MNQIQAQNGNIANNLGGSQVIQQPGEIKILIKASFGSGGDMVFEISMDQSAPFSVFQEFVKTQVFATNQQSAFTNTLLYQLENKNESINENEQRSLKDLGFTNNCTLLVRANLKGGS